MAGSADNRGKQTCGVIEKMQVNSVCSNCGGNRLEVAVKYSFPAYNEIKCLDCGFFESKQEIGELKMISREKFESRLKQNIGVKYVLSSQMGNNI